MAAGPLLSVEGLSVEAAGREILHGVCLEIAEGEVHVLLGPNGGGKTTLLLAIMGMPGLRVTAGRILFLGRDVTAESADTRARSGIALAFQRPPAVRGVTLATLLEQILRRRPADRPAAAQLAAELAAAPLLGREINVGLSGGEIKRSEMLQVRALDPCLALFDEPESGVDLDSITLVGEAMNAILGRGRDRRRRSGLIVTHTGHVLRYVPADRGHVLMGGRIVCRGNAGALFEDIRTHGYEGCLTCRHCMSG